MFFFDEVLSLHKKLNFGSNNKHENDKHIRTKRQLHVRMVFRKSEDIRERHFHGEIIWEMHGLFLLFTKADLRSRGSLTRVAFVNRLILGY